MKTRVIVGILSMLVGLSLFSGTVMADSQSWVDNQLVDGHVVPGITDPLEQCAGPTEAMPVSDGGTMTKLCIGRRTPSITLGGVTGGASGYIRFANDSTAYPLANCPAVSCLYDPALDVVVTKQRSVGQTYSIVIYRHAQQRLQRGVTATNAVGYSFDLTEPDYVTWDINGQSIPTVAMALSNNGRWLGVELMNNGFAIMDMATFAMTKVDNTQFSYGYGMNPSIELAVSNDGKTMAVTGHNASSYLILQEPGCGVDLSVAPVSSASHCEEAALNGLYDIQNGFTYGARPYFNDDNGEFSLAAFYWPSTVRVLTFAAPGFTAPSIDILGMGDSYTSGQGETDDRHYLAGTNTRYEDCHTSDRSYTFLVATLEPTVDVHNIACSGARINDVLNTSDEYTGQSGRLGVDALGLSATEISEHQQAALTNFLPGEVPQMSFVVRYHPKAILIGVGGNDTGFMDKMISCMMPDECDWATTAGKVQTRQEIAGLQPKLTALYQELHRRSPASHIYAVGYPQLMKATGTCDAFIATLFNQHERQFIQESLHYTNQVIAAAASAAGATYVDIEDAYGVHALCGGDRESALNTIQLGDDVSPIDWAKFMTIFGSESFHPTPLGHQLVAATIHHQVTHLIDAPTECPVDGCPTTTPQPPGDWAGESPYVTVNTQLIDNNQIDLHTPFITLTISRSELQPNSLTRIEFHSDPVALGTPVVESDGSLQTTVALHDVTAGAHTLHLFGTSYTGQPIDFYQTIIVRPDAPPAVVSAESDALGKLPTGLISSGTPNMGTTQTAQDEAGVLVFNNDVRQEEVSASQAVKGAQTEKGTRTRLSQKDHIDQAVYWLWRPAVICLLAIGILCVLIVIIGRLRADMNDNGTQT